MNLWEMRICGSLTQLAGHIAEQENVPALLEKMARQDVQLRSLRIRLGVRRKEYVPEKAPEAGCQELEHGLPEGENDLGWPVGTPPEIASVRNKGLTAAAALLDDAAHHADQVLRVVEQSELMQERSDSITARLEATEQAQRLALEQALVDAGANGR